MEGEVRSADSKLRFSFAAVHHHVSAEAEVEVEWKYVLASPGVLELPNLNAQET